MKTTNFADVIRQRLAAEPDLKQKVQDADLDAHVAAEIFNARVGVGLTQAQLAERSGTSQSVVARLEDADYGAYSLKTLKKLARALGKKLRIEFYDEPQYVAQSCVESMEVDLEVGDQKDWTFECSVLEVAT